MGFKTNKKLRIGIYAGAFDPVHAGHVAFALQAMQAAKLDRIVFMPERIPRDKPGIEHFGHRVAMLEAALVPHPSLGVLEVVERHFTVGRTLSTLHGVFPGARFVFLMGSDAVMAMPSWRHADRLIEQCEFIVGLRSSQQRREVLRSIRTWNPHMSGVTLIPSYAPDVSSSKIRLAIRSNRHADGLLSSVRHYARREWLYVSPSHQPAS